MKKLILFVVTIFLCLSMISCEEKNINNNENGSEPNDNISQEGNHTPPYSVSFSSITEMKDFLNSTKGNTAQYEEFIQKNNTNIFITHSNAQSIAKNVEQNDIPLVKSDRIAYEFAATYNLDRNELDLIYRIDGIRYRFVYKYNETSSFVRTTSPVLKGLNLGTYVVDLYQGDECFVGELVTDFAVVQIVVYTEQTSDVTLNVFDMEALQNHVKK